MTPGRLDAVCRALPGTTFEILWGEDQVYKVGGKMFAVVGPRGGLSLKVSDLAFEILVETGAARASPYLARAKWVHFESLADLDDAETSERLAQAHALVAAKLTRARRREIGID